MTRARTRVEGECACARKGAQRRVCKRRAREESTRPRAHRAAGRRRRRSPQKGARRGACACVRRRTRLMCRLIKLSCGALVTVKGCHSYDDVEGAHRKTCWPGAEWKCSKPLSCVA